MDKNHKTYAFKGNIGKHRPVRLLSFMPGMLQVGVVGKTKAPYFSVKSNDMIGLAIALLRAQGLGKVRESEEWRLLKRDVEET